jgi:hypothetical protein
MIVVASEAAIGPESSRLMALEYAEPEPKDVICCRWRVH